MKVTVDSLQKIYCYDQQFFFSHLRWIIAAGQNDRKCLISKGIEM